MSSTRGLAFRDTFFVQGWADHLPPSAASIVTPLLTSGPLTAAELERLLDDPPVAPAGSAAGWSGPAWDDPSGDAAERRAALDLQERVAGYAQHLGVVPVHRMRDVLVLLIACGLVVRIPPGIATPLAEPRYDLAATPPLPGEVLPLTPERRAREDRERWEALHEPLAQAVLRLFDPLGARYDRIRTSVADLAAVLGADPDDVRGALAALLAPGDITASDDVERVPAGRPLDLVVDWRRFDAVRVRVRRQEAVRIPFLRRRGRDKTAPPDLHGCSAGGAHQGRRDGRGT